MNRSLLLGYQLLTGLSDLATGVLLAVAPARTLRLMRLHAPADARVYLSFLGAFVLAVGLSHLYGAFVIYRGSCRRDLEIVWLLTAFLRSSVAIFVFAQVCVGSLEAGWFTVAAFDAICVLVQAMGLHKGWAIHVAR